MGFLTRQQVRKIGFKQVGDNVLISNKASIYQPGKISIGNNTRIDDFVVISAGSKINIGENVHIAVYTSLIGKGEIVIGDFSNFSSRVSIYSSNDDYSGRFMTNPTVGEEFSNVDTNDVIIGKHVIIGCGSVVLPGVTLEDGIAIGALSLVKGGVYKKFSIFGGVPAKFIKARSQRILKLEKKLINIIKRPK